MRVREAWRFRVNGDFLGSFLEVFPGSIVFKFARPDSQIALAAVAPDGNGLWESRWPGLAYFFGNGKEFFIDGECARVVAPDTGQVLQERDLGSDVELRWVIDTGPVYEMPDERRYIGLDGMTLATLWEWRVEGVDPTPEGGRLCSYNPSGDIIVRGLPSLEKAAQIPAPPMPSGAAHTHYEDLFCLFAYTRGGRAGVNLKSGRVEWRCDDPGGYGLTVFDANRAYSPRDRISAYDLRSGSLLWARGFAGVPTCPPAVRGPRLFVATGDGSVHVLNVSNGDIVGSYKLRYRPSGAIEPAPLAPWGEGRIVVGTRREIICLELDE